MTFNLKYILVAALFAFAAWWVWQNYVSRLAK